MSDNLQKVSLKLPTLHTVSSTEKQFFSTAIVGCCYNLGGGPCKSDQFLSSLNPYASWVFWVLQTSSFPPRVCFNVKEIAAQ